MGLLAAWGCLTRCGTCDKLGHRVTPRSNADTVPNTDSSDVFDDFHFERETRYLYLAFVICLDSRRQKEVTMQRVYGPTRLMSINAISDPLVQRRRSLNIQVMLLTSTAHRTWCRTWCLSMSIRTTMSAPARASHLPQGLMEIRCRGLGTVSIIAVRQYSSMLDVARGTIAPRGNTLSKFMYSSLDLWSESDVAGHQPSETQTAKSRSFLSLQQQFTEFVNALSHAAASTTPSTPMASQDYRSQNSSHPSRVLDTSVSGVNHKVRQLSTIGIGLVAILICFTGPPRRYMGGCGSSALSFPGKHFFAFESQALEERVRRVTTRFHKETPSAATPALREKMLHRTLWGWLRS